MKGLPPISNRGWSRHFDEPISLPDGRTLHTLHDAGDYITKLRKAVHSAPEWQAAMEALILVADLGRPTGIMKALNRHRERVFNPDRKDHHWGKRCNAHSRYPMGGRWANMGQDRRIGHRPIAALRSSGEPFDARAWLWIAFFPT